MGACASLCRVDTAPRRAAKGREATPQPACGEAETSEAALPAAADAAVVRLGFACGFAERYELGDELGHGQFATVRAARDRATGGSVAVKLIPKTLLNEAPENADHIRREVCARHLASSRVANRARSRSLTHPVPMSPGQHLEGGARAAARGAAARGVRGRRGGAARVRVRLRLLIVSFLQSGRGVDAPAPACAAAASCSTAWCARAT
jgi:hypothetical protein